MNWSSEKDLKDDLEWRDSEENEYGPVGRWTRTVWSDNQVSGATLAECFTFVWEIKNFNTEFFHFIEPVKIFEYGSGI